MKSIVHRSGPFLWLLILLGCGASGTESAPSASAHEARCRAGGAQCRWDGQCCSGRCYVDTGCSG